MNEDTLLNFEALKEKFNIHIKCISRKIYSINYYKYYLRFIISASLDNQTNKFLFKNIETENNRRVNHK